MARIVDHQAAARAGVDQSARQSGYPLWPKGAMDMDPERHHVPCSGEWSPTRSSWGWWKSTCMDCGFIAMGRTGATFKASKREHLDG